MSYDRLASRLYNTPLLLAPEKAEAIERVLRAYIDGTAATLPPYVAPERPDISTQTSMRFARQRGGYFRNEETGIAIVTALGSMVQRGAGLDAASGIESYESIGARFGAAMADPDVQGILLEVDSYGGEGTGIGALSDLVRAADAEKPIIAHANETAFSAGYWLASAAGELYVPKTGMVGSVGVIMLHVDQSRANDKRGFDVTHITSGARKADFSPHKPLSDTALRLAQEMCDRLYGHFVDHVAAARRISVEAVRSTEAGLLHPDQAASIGMIDGVVSFDQAIQRLAEVIHDPKKRKQYGSAASSARLSSTAQHPGKDEIMSDAAKGAAPTQPAATMYTQEQLDAVKAAADGKATVDVNAIRAAERARISAITGHAEANGRETLAAHIAHNTEMSVDDAAKMLAASPKQAASAAAAPTNLLAAAMAGTPNPKVGAGASGDGGEETAEAMGMRLAGLVNKPKLSAVK